MRGAIIASAKTTIVIGVSLLLFVPSVFTTTASLAQDNGDDDRVRLPPSREPYKHFPCGDCRYNLVFENKSYSLAYTLYGEPYGDPEGVKLQGVSAEKSNKTITVDIYSPDQDGLLVISFPIRLTTAEIDFDTWSFFVDDRELIPGKEVLIDRYYVFLLEFPKGTDKIRFVGLKEAGVNDEINRVFTLNATSTVESTNGTAGNITQQYEILYNVTNGRLEDVQQERVMPYPNAYDGILILDFIPVGKDAAIHLQFPRQLLDKVMPINTFGAEIGGEFVPVIENVTCDYRILIIDVGDRWIEDPIMIYGMLFDDMESKQFIKEDNALLVIDKERPEFLVYASENHDVCGWAFSAEDKRLDIDVRQNSTELKVRIPDGLLGDPYTIFATTNAGDNSGDKVKIEDFEQSTENTTIFRNGQNIPVTYHDLDIRYQNGTEAITIVGAAAAPEFGMIAPFGMAGALAATIILVKRFTANRM